MKKQLAFNITFLIVLLMGAAGCGNDRLALVPAKTPIADSAHVADSAARAQLYDEILQIWVLNGRKSNNKLDSAQMEHFLKRTHLWGEKIIRDDMAEYLKRYGFAWQPPAYYLDSSSKPLAFYQRPLTPEELSEQKAAMLSLKSDKKPSPIP